VVEGTYYLNRTSQVFETDYNINQVDPQIAYTYKEQTLAVVDNPFYNILPVEKFPGPLRYQQQVDVTSLAKPYPQYGSIIVVDGAPGGAMKYNAFQLKVTKNYSQGLSLLAGYSYHVEKDEVFYNDIDTYNRHYTEQNAHNFRHRITIAGTYDLPVGRGKAFLGGASRALDAFIGGWQFSGIMFWRSGNMLGFGGMIWDGTNPVIDNPTPERWFNTDAFQRLPDYTPRTNPMDFPGLMGPGQFNMDGSLTKEVKVTERLKAKFQVDAFNLFNNMSWSDPDTSLGGTFGQCTDQAYLLFGRRLQLGARLEF
jgi:hypothetical protein